MTLKKDLLQDVLLKNIKNKLTKKATEGIVLLLKSVAPESCLFNKFFEEVFHEGTGKEFDYSVNKMWTQTTRPIVEAFFHAKFFLEMMFKYGTELTHAPDLMPSGWAALLYFFNLR